MSKTLLLQTYAQSLQTQKLQNTIALPIAIGTSKTHIRGLVGSSFSFVISNVFKQVEKSFLLIFNDKEEAAFYRSEEHTSELQSRRKLVCRLLLEKKNYICTPVTH